jgi:hypothetical protein
MADTLKVYTRFAANILGSATPANTPNVDWMSDSIYIALLNGYVPNQDTHEFWADVVASELANGNGYATNGIILTGKAMTQAGHVITLDSTLDPTWSGATFTASHAVIYNRTPATDALRQLIAYITFGAPMSPVAGSLVVQFNAAGIMTLTVA